MTTSSPPQHLIGSRISVVSHHEMRYEGTLHDVNVNDASVIIQNGELTPGPKFCSD